MEVTEDALLDGRIRLVQPADGYRVAIDPVLLAAAVPAAAGDAVLDVGAGVGAAALCLAARVPGCRVYGMELQSELVTLARHNVGLNGLTGRVDVLLGDIARRPPPRLAPGTFRHVISNPPHMLAAATQPPPHAGKATANVEGTVELAAWLSFCLVMLQPKGTLTLVHRADRLADLLTLLAPRAGDISILPLWPKADRPAKRILVRARKGVATPLRLQPGLVLHAADGGYTAAAEAVLRHGAALPMSDDT